MNEEETQDPSDTPEDEELLALLEEVATKKEELEKELEALKAQRLSTLDDLTKILQPKLDEYMGEITTLIETEVEDLKEDIEKRAGDSETTFAEVYNRIDEVLSRLSIINRLQSEIKAFAGEITNAKSEVLQAVAASETSSKEVAYRALGLINELTGNLPDIADDIVALGNRIDGLPEAYDDTEVWDELEKLRKLINTNHGGGQANRQINVKSSVMSLKFTDINFQNSTSIGWTATDDTTNKRVNITASVLLAGSGGGGSLTVKEIDGTPTVASVTTIRVSNGTMTDDGGGQVTISTGGGSTGITRISSLITATTLAGNAASTDYVYIAAAGIAFTLPDAATVSNLYTLKNASPSSVLITAVGGDTLDGNASVLLSTQYSALDFISDGTNWNLI